MRIWKRCRERRKYAVDLSSSHVYLYEKNANLRSIMEP